MQTSNLQYAEYTAWNPKDYLGEYYASIMDDEKFCLEFLVESLRRVSSVPVALDFGSGPIVSHILPLATKAAEIHVSEYLESNLSELQKWVKNQSDAFNWRQFTSEVLRLEGNLNPTQTDIENREQKIRQQITQLLPGDVRETNPLGLEKREFYPLVTAHYCAEGISPNRDSWRIYMSNIMSMVKPGGTLITSACGSGTFYRVADLYFPSTKLEPQDVLNCFWDNGFFDVDIRVRQLPECEAGFFYVIFACGVKSR
ncbi:MAG: guanitoxin biosynthesis pre-guanitoxin forming N-methyltransferase GntF [Nostoc sp. ChiSLP02]|nr:guanitoxin biosynthesis pre-guanitoxin forming N-methyltransferase GntF [Nostoc sp. DedSLP05]MDZ8097771.1 guanitoxin biosynthesis pre-guanitoxin forming N-methyltransferase GntF [Nostoc sp. DedSLP01]MDZ8183856.1 guanitoxin biosynthesis pre-guanitoxin forming N-methyltransferase GntF [Nostoc sp. ChiSLP02]